MKACRSYALGLVALLAATGVQKSSAEVNWRLQLSGMYQRIWDFPKFFFENHDELKHMGYGNLGAELCLQIPMGQTSPFYIETGLGWLYKAQFSTPDDYDFKPEFLSTSDREMIHYSDVSIIEMPIKFGYALRLNKKSRVEFGVGPYFSTALKYADGNSWSGGLSASVAYRYKKMSYGVSWENPIFFNGPRDHYKNTFQVTIGLNFSLGGMRDWDWDAIATSMDALGNSLQATTAQLAEMQGNSYQESASAYSSGSTSGSSRSSNGGSNFSLSEQQSYNRDKTTYERYDSQLAAHFAGNQKMSASSVKSAQNKMKQLRQKWEKRGKSFPRSANEDR